jgi:hypothetical protein
MPTATVEPMTRKDFVAIAAVFKNQLDVTVDSDERRTLRNMAHEIADVCADTNPRFDHGRFLDACGVYE